MRATLILLGALLCAGQVQASELDLSFNGDAFRARFARQFTGSTLGWDAGWLHHSDNGEALHGGLFLTGQASDGQQALQGGLGLRASFVDGDLSDQTGLGIGLGGFLRYPIPRYNRFVLSGHVYFAPDILGIGDLNELQDYGVRLGYNVLKQADVFIGARYVRADYDRARSAYFDTGMHLGVSLRF